MAVRQFLGLFVGVLSSVVAFALYEGFAREGVPKMPEPIVCQLENFTDIEIFYYIFKMDKFPSLVASYLDSNRGVAFWVAVMLVIQLIGFLFLFYWFFLAILAPALRAVSSTLLFVFGSVFRVNHGHELETDTNSGSSSNEAPDSILSDVESNPGSPLINLESMRPGSNLVSASVARCQVGIYVCHEGKEAYIASGFRLEDCIVTAAHAIPSDVLLYGRDRTRGVEIEYDRWIQPDDFDVFYCRLTALELGVLGVPKAGIPRASVTKEDRMYVNVSSINNSSGGSLSGSEDFGRVIYQGSTVPGFSGAPYYCGKAVYGMHCGSGGSNFGLDIHLIMLVCGMVLETDPTKNLIDKLNTGFRPDKNDYKILRGNRVLYRHRRGYQILSGLDDYMHLFSEDYESATIDGNFLDQPNDAARQSRSKIPNTVESDVSFVPAQKLPVQSATLESALSLLTSVLLGGLELTPAQKDKVLACTLESSSSRSSQPRKKAK